MKTIKKQLENTVRHLDYAKTREILTEHPELLNAPIDSPSYEMDDEGNWTDVIDDEPSGYTPLLMALSFGDYKMFKLLIEEFGADVNQGNYENFTPIFKLSSSNPLSSSEEKEKTAEDYLNLLYAHNVNVNNPIDIGKTPLMIASQRGNLYQVKKLLEHGADANAKDIYGNVFNWMGNYTGDKKDLDEIVKLLVEHGADINNKGNIKTALDDALENNDILYEKILRKYGAKDSSFIPDDFLNKT